jgi:uracil-DNA glycosylase
MSEFRRTASTTCPDTNDNRLRDGLRAQYKQLSTHWKDALNQAPLLPVLKQLAEFLDERLAAGATIFPHRIFRALDHLTPNDVKVVILGQDPYHGPGQAQGLAFSVPNTLTCPPSLRTMFKELAMEYPGTPARKRNDLSDWAAQGVLLLNTSLTVEAGQAGSHAKRGWEAVTDALIADVARTPQPKVFMLWGNHAQAKRDLIQQEQAGPTLILASNHPSPLSAQRPPVPFIGCGHFKKANDWLQEHGQTPVQWL